MKNDILTNLKNQNIDPAQLTRRINMVYILPDILEQYSMEVEGILRAAGQFKYEDKQQLTQIISLCRRWVKGVDKILSQDGQSLFGQNADEIKTMIDKEVQITNNIKL